VSHDISCCLNAFADDYKLYLNFSRKDKESELVGITSLKRSLDRIDIEIVESKIESRKVGVYAI
jgi:hypothetical protein